MRQKAEKVVMDTIQFSKVKRVDDYRIDLEEDTREFDNLFKGAKSEIQFYNWCLEILESYVGLYFAGIVGVFLFKIKPASVEVDEWIWVVVGDLPPIYITAEQSPNAACALDSYIGAMEEWVDAASSGKSVEGLVPVNVLATKENAEKLKVRLTMLDEYILSNLKEDLDCRYSNVTKSKFRSDTKGDG
jgi:hypothetical protein